VSVTIARAALESIFDECDKYNVDETGGKVIGIYRNKGSNYEITVSGMIGPGPNAQRSSTSLFQDGDYQEQVFRRIEKQHPDVEHLGSWHTHHVNGYPTLSGGDITTYRNIVNHHKHNTDFFYALLVVRKNGGRGSRYDVKHFFFRRGHEAVDEIPSSDVRIVDMALLTEEGEAARHETRSSPAVRRGQANPERAKDQEFFAEFYPDLKSLFSERLGVPYWKGPLTLIDGSRIDVVAVESTDSHTPAYSIVTAGDNETCAEMLTGYKDRKFGAARHAIVQLEKDLNRAIYQNR
jgi:hypothetical protein